MSTHMIGQNHGHKIPLLWIIGVRGGGKSLVYPPWRPFFDPPSWRAFRDPPRPAGGSRAEGSISESNPYQV